VFQDPSVDDRLTGRKNLEMHADLYGVLESEMKSQIDKMLELVELSDRSLPECLMYRPKGNGLKDIGSRP
jgi:ABC-type multidrug transport system ATPase subunit